MTVMEDEAILTTDDLPVVNEALRKGFDVRIQRTKDGYRILSDTVKVLKKIKTDK